jgi:rare lipoprotein A
MGENRIVTVNRLFIAIICFIVIGMLSACSSGKKRDYAYKPTPRSETRVSVGESTECYASWYGKDFHGRPTASGEIFDMHGLTCAHKVYPLGTKVRVTNLSNSKDVECIINDRGPFIPGRDLDLSYGAARKIDLIGPGVAKVRLEVLGREQRYQKEIKFGKTEGLVTIQAGAFKDEENAKNLKRGLDLHYQDVYIMKVSVKSATYHRVRIGKFKDRAEALKIAEPLAREGYNVLVTKYEKNKE